LPTACNSWLLNEDKTKLCRSANVRVALGLNDSFVAWDGDAVRWSKIPSKLEEKLQEWISHRDKYGRLRIVCLGQNESYFATTEEGWWSCSRLPARMYEELTSGDRKEIGKTIVSTS
jgi:hypothetical protein